MLVDAGRRRAGRNERGSGPSAVSRLDDVGAVSALALFVWTR